MSSLRGGQQHRLDLLARPEGGDPALAQHQKPVDAAQHARVMGD
jgi:hypothetical protein